MLNCFTYYCVARSIQKRRIIRTALWSALSYFLTTQSAHAFSLSSIIVKSIHLHEDGTKVDVSFLDNSVAIIDIGSISRISEGANKSTEQITEASIAEKVEAFQLHSNRFRHLSSEYLPVLIKGQLFALDMDCHVYNKGILNAITRGAYVETPGMKKLYEKGLANPKWLDITNL